MATERPAPTVPLHVLQGGRQRRHDDPLSAARGLLLGLAIGLAFWFAVIVLAVIASA
jgi:hypothetical protein